MSIDRHVEALLCREEQGHFPVKRALACFHYVLEALSRNLEQIELSLQ